jgi:hypothetical protein
MDIYYKKLLRFVDNCNNYLHKEAQNSKPIFMENLKEYYQYIKDRDFFEEKYSCVYLFGNKDNETNKINNNKDRKSFNNYNYQYKYQEKDLGKVNTVSDIFTNVIKKQIK